MFILLSSQVLWEMFIAQISQQSLQPALRVIIVVDLLGDNAERCQVGLILFELAIWHQNLLHLVKELATDYFLLYKLKVHSLKHHMVQLLCLLHLYY